MFPGFFDYKSLFRIKSTTYRAYCILFCLDIVVLHGKYQRPQIWARCLHLYDGKHGIAWKWQSADGTFERSPTGGKEAGPNPTDHAKPNIKSICWSMAGVCH